MPQLESRLNKLERSKGAGEGNCHLILVPGSWRVDEEPPEELLAGLLEDEGIEPKPEDTVMYVIFVRSNPAGLPLELRRKE